jgi:hypothetical protein
MCANRPIHDGSDGSGTHQEAIVVKVHTTIVAVVMKAELSRVPLGQEILHVHVGDVHLLIPLLEGIEPAVCVLFEKVEPRQVVSNPVRAQVSKNTNARLFFRKQEAAKITGELLDPGPDRNKIVIWTQVAQLRFDKRLLHAHMSIEPIRSLARIDIDDSPFTRLQEIQIHFWREAKT